MTFYFFFKKILNTNNFEKLKKFPKVDVKKNVFYKNLKKRNKAFFLNLVYSRHISKNLIRNNFGLFKFVDKYKNYFFRKLNKLRIKKYNSKSAINFILKKPIKNFLKATFLSFSSNDQILKNMFNKFSSEDFLFFNYSISKKQFYDLPFKNVSQLRNNTSNFFYFYKGYRDQVTLDKSINLFSNFFSFSFLRNELEVLNKSEGLFDFSSSNVNNLKNTNITNCLLDYNRFFSNKNSFFKNAMLIKSFYYKSFVNFFSSYFKKKFASFYIKNITFSSLYFSKLYDNDNFFIFKELNLVNNKYLSFKNTIDVGFLKNPLKKVNVASYKNYVYIKQLSTQLKFKKSIYSYSIVKSFIDSKFLLSSKSGMKNMGYFRRFIYSLKSKGMFYKYYVSKYYLSNALGIKSFLNKYNGFRLSSDKLYFYTELNILYKFLNFYRSSFLKTKINFNYLMFKKFSYNFVYLNFLYLKNNSQYNMFKYTSFNKVFNLNFNVKGYFKKLEDFKLNYLNLDDIRLNVKNHLFYSKIILLHKLISFNSKNYLKIFNNYTNITTLDDSILYYKNNTFNFFVGEKFLKDILSNIGLRYTYLNANFFFKNGNYSLFYFYLFSLLDFVFTKLSKKKYVWYNKYFFFSDLKNNLNKKQFNIKFSVFDYLFIK